MPLLYDPTYLIIIPAIIFAMIAQANVKSAFEKYSDIRNSRGLTGRDIARQILDANGLYNVPIEHISGSMTDHYDPKTNVVRLSDTVYDKTSIAAAGVAAHEVGHAIQHAVGYAPMALRSAIIPVTQFGSMAAFPLVILGLVLAFKPLITFGIILYTAVVLFQAVTLPVEFNASRRALQSLEGGILPPDENEQAKKVLTAAALTYVAAMLSALLSLLRLIVLANRRK